MQRYSFSRKCCKKIKTNEKSLDSATRDVIPTTYVLLKKQGIWMQQSDLQIWQIMEKLSQNLPITHAEFPISIRVL